MSNERIMFFGTPEFACCILQALIDEKYNVIAVVSQPDKPVGRKHRIEPTPVHALAAKYGIDVLQPEKLRDDMDQILAYQPDLIVTCAYGQFVPVKILEAPRLGCVNIHPSLLPKYRGGAPIHHAILNGDKETGVCLMEMVKAMDAGRVWARTVLPIGDDETQAELSARLETASVQLLKEALPKYIAGELEGEPQDEAGVVIAPNIPRELEKVSFQEEDLTKIYNHIRALIDWPVSYGVVDGKRMKFYRVRKQETEHQAQIGEVLGFEKGAMKVACRGGILLVQELQPEGKKRMDAQSFANGAGRELIGKVFE